MSQFLNDSLSKQILREELFTGSHIFYSITKGSIEYLHIKTGSLECVFSVDIIVNASYIISLYTGATTSADGTSIPNYNMRASSSETLLTTTFYTPTISVAGTSISSVKTGDDGRLSKASAFDSQNGVILDANSSNIVSLHSQSAPLTSASITWFLREI